MVVNTQKIKKIKLNIAKKSAAETISDKLKLTNDFIEGANYK